MIRQGLDLLSPGDRENADFYLGSVPDIPSKYGKWVKKQMSIGQGYGTVCKGDAGAPLFYWDQSGDGKVYLIGMSLGKRTSRLCGDYDVDKSISLIRIARWLSFFIPAVPAFNSHDPLCDSDPDNCDSSYFDDDKRALRSAKNKPC